AVDPDAGDNHTFSVAGRDAGLVAVAGDALLLAMPTACVWAAPWSVTFNNSLNLDNAGFSVAELSGVTWLDDGSMTPSFLAISDEGGTVTQFDAQLSPTGLTVPTATTQWSIADTSLDTEGIAFHPNDPSSVYVAYERDTSAGPIIPGVRQYSLTGQLLDTVNLPAPWTTNGNTRNNRGFESLSRSPAGQRMWVANEEALTIDGPLASPTNGTTVRLQQLAIQNENVSAGAQYAYEVDPIHGTLNADRSGLVELVVLPDGNVLALERSTAVTSPIFENRIYQIDFSGATDVSTPPFDNGLTGVTYTPVSKTLLWSGSVLGVTGANLEGLSVGPQVAPGQWALVGVADSGSGSDDLIVSFTLTADEAYADFNRDESFDCADINSLTAAIVAGTHASAFDLTGDGLVDGADQAAWLAAAAVANDLSGPYLVGDANLDGLVDGQDFIAWNNAKFTNSTAWCDGNFNHDAVVDGQDFVAWNGNKFMAAGAALGAVPEPAVGLPWMLGLLLIRAARQHGLGRKKGTATRPST
ncbi:MAG: esterase-like activity of phytase family protein, partial [Planctomycetota bacterium]